MMKMIGIATGAFLSIFMVIPAWAQNIPDVSGWCTVSTVTSVPEIGAKACVTADYVYLKIKGELVFIHEHRVKANEKLFYSALKDNDGKWVELISSLDISSSVKRGVDGFIYTLRDEQGKILGIRHVPFTKTQ